MDKPLTPLGALLESAREAVRPKLSQNQAAKRAKTSSTTYRRVITGIARLGGRDVPFEGDPETIARIARALDIDPAKLDEIGKDDVAYELRRILLMEARDAAIEGDRKEAVAPSEPDPLAGLPDDPGERIAELSRRVNERTREIAQLSGEIARTNERESNG